MQKLILSEEYDVTVTQVCGGNNGVGKWELWNRDRHEWGNQDNRMWKSEQL